MNSSKLNIALFSPSLNPYSETFIQAHRRLLSDKVFYYYGTTGHIKLQGCDKNLVELGVKELVYLKIIGRSKEEQRWRKLSKSLIKKEIDIVFIEFGNHAYRLLPLFDHLVLPFVVIFHGYDAFVRSIIDQCANYQGVFSQASFVIAVSKSMKNHLIALGCDKHKIGYSPCGPDSDFLKVESTLESKMLLCVGRFTNKKAPYFTILAFAKVLEIHPDAILNMVGEGELLDTCMKLVNYLKINHAVHFSGIVNKEEIIQLMQNARGFVQHSIEASNGDMEGTPVAIMEAQLAGLPVISTKHSGIIDVVINLKTGILCDEGDVCSMSKAMIEILDNKNLAQDLGRAGRERIISNYSQERHISYLQEILLKHKTHE